MTHLRRVGMLAALAVAGWASPSLAAPASGAPGPANKGSATAPASAGPSAPRAGSAASGPSSGPSSGAASEDSAAEPEGEEVADDPAAEPGAAAVEVPTPEAMAEKVDDHEARLRELEDIVENLERKNAVQRLGWSADYRITLSSFRYSGDALDGARDDTGKLKQVTLRNVEQWTHRVRLSMQADPSPRLRFRARLVAFKRFGDTEFGPMLDGAQGRVPRDSIARFDRFWLDWFATDHLSFSFGRISTTDGSPAELRENLDRPAATISLGLVDSEYDAVAATYQVGPLLLRAFYLAWQFQREDDPFGVMPFLARDSQPDRIFGAGLMYRSSGGKAPSFELSGYLNPKFRAVYPVELPQADGSVIKPTNLSTSYGKLGAATALLLWKEPFKGLDFFISASVSYSDSNGRTIDYPVGPEGASVPVLTLVGGDVNQHLSYQGYTGLRLTSPVGGLRAPRVGIEMTYGSRYLVTFATPTTDLVSRIGVRGRTYDVYLIQPVYQNLFARLSWTLLDYDYAPPLGGGFGFVAALGGTAPATARRIQGVNLMLHATF